MHKNYDRLDKNEQKILNKLIITYLKYEYGVYINENKIQPILGIFDK